MKKRKFDIFYESVINSLNSNPLDQQYFNELNTTQHGQPLEYNGLFIQLFKDKYGYYAYILDNYNVVKQCIVQRFKTDQQSIEYAKQIIDKNYQIKQVRLQKTEKRFGHKPHTRIYDYINSASEEDFSIDEDKLTKFIQLLNQSDLVQEYKKQYYDFLTPHNNYTNQQLIDGGYTLIDINLISASTLKPGMRKILFRLILPYTQLNWFNRIFRDALESVRTSDIVKENIDEIMCVTKKDTLLSLLYDLTSEAYAIGYGDGSSEHEDRDILEDNSIHDTIVKIEELFDNNIMENKDEK